MTILTGIILAGGQGRRMGGQDKGLVQLDGRPLYQHVLERLRPQVDIVMINANRNIDRYQLSGCRVIQDVLMIIPVRWPGSTVGCSPSTVNGPLFAPAIRLQYLSTSWKNCSINAERRRQSGYVHSRAIILRWR